MAYESRYAAVLEALEHNFYFPSLGSLRALAQ